MKNILVFCSRDWRHPKAGLVERYAHNVFSRIAAQGNFVGWVCQNQFLSFGKSRLPQVEMLDGIQVARLAPSLLYRTMAQMFMSRLEKRKTPTRRMDVIIDCVVEEPLPLEKTTNVPIIPLVFNLGKKVQASDTPPGPVIAATRRARGQLTQAGFPEKFLIQAPHGVDLARASVGSCPDETAPTLVAVEDSPKGLNEAVRTVQNEGLGLAVDFVSLAATEETDRRHMYQRALIGYCGEGAEEEALAFAAQGVPVICPATDAAREFVVDAETGLLFQPGDNAHLADCIRRLVKDEILRKRLAARAREIAETRSWDRTAGLILATIENLEQMHA